MVLPEGSQLGSYRWPVHGLQVTLIWPDASRESVFEFGEHLIRFGADLVVAPFDGQPDGGFYFRGQS